MPPQRKADFKNPKYFLTIQIYSERKNIPKHVTFNLHSNSVTVSQEHAI